MSKPWQPYALHVLDAISKIRRIQTRGDIVKFQCLILKYQFFKDTGVTGPARWPLRCLVLNYRFSDNSRPGTVRLYQNLTNSSTYPFRIQ